MRLMDECTELEEKIGSGFGQSLENLDWSPLVTRMTDLEKFWYEKVFSGLPDDEILEKDELFKEYGGNKWEFSVGMRKLIECDTKELYWVLPNRGMILVYLFDSVYKREMGK